MAYPNQSVLERAPVTGFDSVEGLYQLVDTRGFDAPKLKGSEHAELAPFACRLSVVYVPRPDDLHNDSTTLSSRQDSQSAQGNDRIVAADMIMTTSASFASDMHTMYNCRKCLYIHRNFESSAERLNYTDLAQAPIAHDFNSMTRGPDHLEVAVGWTSGEVVVHDLKTAKTTWLNKKMRDKRFKNIKGVKWLPGSSTQFLISFDNGLLQIFDRERSDLAYPEADLGKDVANGEIYIVENELPDANPASTWKVANSAITAFAFSPDTIHLALVTRGGQLIILNMQERRVVMNAPSYFGGFLCVSWSADGKYLLTGGEDDLVSVWSFHDFDLVARCKGHNSWVTAVAFDPHSSDEHTYRFGSVGQDAHLLLWDFAVETLSMPRVTVKQFEATASAASPHHRSKRRIWNRRKGANGHNSQANQDPAHTVCFRSKTEVPFIEPIVAARVHEEPVTDLYFHTQYLFTICQLGEIKLWKRPVTDAVLSSSV